MPIDDKKAFVTMFDQVRQNWGEKYGVEVINQARDELAKSAEANFEMSMGNIGEYFGLLSAKAEELYTSQKKVVPIRPSQKQPPAQQEQESGFHLQVNG